MYDNQLYFSKNKILMFMKGSEPNENKKIM